MTFGTECEGKRKPGFAALGSGLPEGGAPVLCFPLCAHQQVSRDHILNHGGGSEFATPETLVMALSGLSAL